MLKHLRRARFQARLERVVQVAHTLPVVTELVQRLLIELAVARRMAQHLHHGVEVGLRGEAGEGAQGHVHHVHARLHGLEVGGGLQRRRVVGVQVNGQLHRIAQSLNQLGGGVGLEQAGHVLDAEDVRPGIFELLGQLQIVVERVLAALGVQNVAGIADAGLGEAVGLVAHEADAGLHAFKPVQRVEDAENIDAGFGRLGHETLGQVVGVRLVAHAVGPADEHLQQDVGHGGAQAGQAFPGVFVQEAQGHVKRGAAPHFQRERLGVLPGVGAGHAHHVVGAHAGGEQALVGVAQGGVGVVNQGLGAQPLPKLLRPQLAQLLLGAGSGCCGSVGGGQVGRAQRAGRVEVAGHVGVAVHHHVSDEGEQARGPVAAGLVVKQFGVVLDEVNRGVARLKDGVAHDVLQE